MYRYLPTTSFQPSLEHYFTLSWIQPSPPWCSQGRHRRAAEFFLHNIQISSLKYPKTEYFPDIYIRYFRTCSPCKHILAPLSGYSFRKIIFKPCLHLGNLCDFQPRSTRRSPSSWPSAPVAWARPARGWRGGGDGGRRPLRGRPGWNTWPRLRKK